MNEFLGFLTDFDHHLAGEDSSEVETKFNATYLLSWTSIIIV